MILKSSLSYQKNDSENFRTMDTRLVQPQDSLLSGIDRFDCQHNTKSIVSNEDVRHSNGMVVPSLVDRKYSDGDHNVDKRSTVGYGPNVFLHNNESNRNSELALNHHDWVFITGGCGYIGSHLAAHLKTTTKYKIMIIDKNAMKISHTTRYCDIFADEDFTSPTVIQALRDYKPICVIHLADSNTNDAFSCWDINVSKTLKLLQECNSCNVRNFIFGSSGAVYKDSELSLTETDICNPENAGSRSKYSIELALKDYWTSYGMRSISFRCFNVAGSHSLYDLGELPNSETIISKIMKSNVYNTPFEIFGKDYDTPDGTGIRDYIHVMDIIEAFTTAITWLSDNADAHIINLGSGNPYSVQQIVDKSEKIFNKEFLYKYGNRRSGDTAKRFANIDKAKNLLNWEPKRNIEDIFSSSLRWYTSGVYKDLIQRKIQF